VWWKADKSEVKKIKRLQERWILKGHYNTREEPLQHDRGDKIANELTNVSVLAHAASTRLPLAISRLIKREGGTKSYSIASHMMSAESAYRPHFPTKLNGMK